MPTAAPVPTARTDDLFTPACSDALRGAVDRIEVAFPPANDSLDQDEEWVVTNSAGRWRKVRLHDYHEVFAVPGLYEKWVYDVLGCHSPQVVCRLLREAVAEAGQEMADLRVLDFGAGNGYVAGLLRGMGAEAFLGADLHREAADAAERDRPGLYDDYVVGDITDLDPERAGAIESFGPNCLTCVAALGFGDVPPKAFAAAVERVEQGGWLAFTIRDRFLEARDKSGFAGLIGRMLDSGRLELARRERFVHRVASDGEELVYEALVGRKRA